MRSSCFYFLLALYLSTHVVDADVSFSMPSATTETYKQFITELRIALTVTSKLVYGIPVLQSKITGPESFILVHLTNYKSESITVVIEAVNVYVRAYRTGNNLYVLSDTSTEAEKYFKKLFKNLNEPIWLKYKGTYDGLETAAGRISREKIDLGFSEFSSSIGNMFHHNDVNLVARGFIVIIQTISEAARFKYIEQTVSNNVETKFFPDAAMISLENRWSDLCEQIQIAQNHGGKFARTIEVRSIKNKPIYVSNVESKVVKGIDLLLYYKVSVAKNNFIATTLSPKFMNFLGYFILFLTLCIGIFYLI